jgi:hypothetical protein
VHLPSGRPTRRRHTGKFVAGHHWATNSAQVCFTCTVEVPQKIPGRPTENHRGSHKFEMPQRGDFLTFVIYIYTYMHTYYVYISSRAHVRKGRQVGRQAG